ncbi:hypothetical protein [Ramlibacter sp.]|uniref:hypothetical protein n=1 Tax=Ramlibacter sp. TaxID=1917967 RepID=UPI00185BD21A|nr:hypothetical protein [Ramlibacter sp.]MBA2676601.1 hypothetical protein [Ramlibacter sp.]
MTEPIADPRTTCRQLIKESVDPSLWERNEAFTHKLVNNTILAHRLHSHPILQAWENSEFDLRGMQVVHMEIRAAFLEVFSESLLRLMQTTLQLEPTLGFKAKLAARFLVQLNVADEIGFTLAPGADGSSGHPRLSHYWLLADAMAKMGLDEATWRAYRTCPPARATRATLEGNQGDHLRLAVVLACIETVFMPYYGPWGRNSIRVCPSLAEPGTYHSVHIEDEKGDFVDDDHSEDSWYVVRQALVPARYEEIERLTTESLDTWAQLFDFLLTQRRQLQ